MSEPVRQASGADAARQALAAWKAGRTPGQAPAPRKKPRRIREDRTGGRDPIGLGALLGRINDEQGWEVALDGGNLLDQWKKLCPDRYRGHLEPVAFDAQNGRLEVRPDSHTYAAELRMFAPMLARELNTKLGRTVVRDIRVLSVGAIDSPTGDLSSRPPAESPAPPSAPKAKDPRYLSVLKVHQDHKPDRTRHLNPKVAAAIEASNRALVDPRKREDRHAFTDAVAQAEMLREKHEREHPSDPLIASIRAALEYKRGGGQTVRRIFEVS